MVVHESVMICVDNSEWMRNGDFPPSRLQCQQDAAHLLLQYKIRLSPENTVGIISMADTVEVLASPCSEKNKLIARLHQVQPMGVSNVVAAIKVAYLALKNRQNHKHKMHIIVFVGSPVDQVDSAELIKMAKRMKKEKVIVDLICFGEADANCNDVFGAFVESLTYKEGDGSNLIVVSPGSTLSEALVTSSLVKSESGAVVPSSGGGYELDSEIDADLALALRVSLEEQRHNLAQNQGGNTTNEYNQANTDDVMSMDPSLMTEEQQLEWALRMSMQETNVDTTTADTGIPMEIDTSANTEAMPGLTEVPGTSHDAKSEKEVASQNSEGGPSTSGKKEDKKKEDVVGVFDPNLLDQYVDELSGAVINLEENNRDAVETSHSEKKETKEKEKE